MRVDGVGSCEACGRGFDYELVHNGFNDSAFAYCDRCGCQALLSFWHATIPEDAPLERYGVIEPEVEALLSPCACGGAFRASASPRCPHCNAPLWAEAAGRYIEAHAPARTQGWRWQGTWRGLYSMIVEGRLVRDSWRSP